MKKLICSVLILGQLLLGAQSAHALAPQVATLVINRMLIPMYIAAGYCTALDTACKKALAKSLAAGLQTVADEASAAGVVASQYSANLPSLLSYVATRFPGAYFSSPETTPLTTDQSINWGWMDFGKIKLSGDGMGKGDISQYQLTPSDYTIILGLYPPTAATAASGGVVPDVYFRTSTNTARHFRTKDVSCPPQNTFDTAFCSGSTTTLTSTLNADMTASYGGPFPGAVNYWNKPYTKTVSNVNGVIRYQVVYEEQPKSGGAITVPVYQPKAVAASAAVYDLPPGSKTLPLSDQHLSDTANRIFKIRTIEADEQGQPWPFVSNPPLVTSADVAKWRSQTPAAQIPTVNDWVSGIVSPGTPGVVVPVPDVDAPIDTPIGTNPIDLGPAPTIPTPTLGDQKGLSDISHIFEQTRAPWESFTCPAQLQDCPTWTFTTGFVFGSPKTFTLNICTMAEQAKPVVQILSMIGYWVAAFFIIVSA